MSDNQIKVGVGVVIIKDGQILLAKRKGSHAQGVYGSCGGHMEFGESPIEGRQKGGFRRVGR